MARDPETANQRPNSSGRQEEHGSGRGMRSANVNPNSMNPRPPDPSLNPSTRDGGVQPSVQPETQSSGPDPAATRPGRTFRCADVGNADCRWEVSGHTADELLPQIEAHAREHHGVSQYDERARRRILDAIHERRAA